MEEALKERRCAHGNFFRVWYCTFAFYAKGKLLKIHYILCNGFKMPLYTQYISELLNDGFKNCIPILDENGRVRKNTKNVTNPYRVGIRVGADEEPKFEFTSSSRHPYSDIIPFTKKHQEEQRRPWRSHFFIKHRDKDTAYYWVN